MLEKIREIITQYVEIDPESITENTGLRGELQMNSFDFMNIITALEEEYGIEIPDRVFGDIQTVGDLMKFIQENKK